eukprot:CAMPEP_0172474322 /NCGR_PEP_ID=MMETSP1065-20121228/69300_1 /TAXON_ID=265537 /ORGANISM="Amphiprora paludosa, Strain CCMP125" /LENGTH=2018 /DNA_ID=CAMNT_0013232501 /DNA_START=332 /DNA_END=6388 /DNA_ORIENTATION=+
MSDLGGFLDKAPARKKGSSATVGGNTPEGEIYIRADGKKVRRVKKTKKSSSDDDSQSLGGADPLRSPKGSLKRNTSSGSLASLDAGAAGKKSLTNFLGSSTPASGSRKSGSATVSGDRPSQDGDVYIRADGKKVRRVKKNTQRTSSGSLDHLVQKDSSTTSEVASPGKKKKDLGSFLNQSGGSIRSGAKSVSGMSASGRSTTSKSKDGEIYTNKDGKKVRRVKKSSSASVGGDPRRSSSSASVGGEPSSRKPIGRTPSQSKLSNGDPKKPVGRTTSSSSLAQAEKSVKRSNSSSNLDAPSKPVRQNSSSNLAKPVRQNSGSNLVKMVRRNSGSNLVKPVRQNSASNLGADTDKAGGLGGLKGFLDKGDRPKTSGRAGSASVAGSTPATQGDVYIRADGKKVRRVKRSASSAASASSPITSSTKEVSKEKESAKEAPGADKKSSLSGFLGTNASPAGSKKSGSATVSGDGRNQEGEIYIRPDGKKVRRVRRAKSSAASASGSASVSPSTSTNKESPGLGGFLSKSAIEAGPKNSGAATVTGATSSKDKEGEVYIRPDGKKVRRVKRSASAAAKNSAGDLAGFMDKKDSGTKKSPTSGSASVAVSNPSSQEGEIYIRPDGKKVRRVRRAKSSAASVGAPSTTSSAPKAPGRSDGGRTLSALLDNNPNAKKSTGMGGAATVAGDRVVKSTPEGEIVIRADGKKVRRIRKTTSSSASQPDGEVYRRADGKLVRRVRKTVTSTGIRGGAGDLAGYMDKTAKDNSSGRGAATVAGERPSLDARQIPQEPEKTGPVSTLSPEDEKAAETYRKMLSMGLPDDAVKHKMQQDDVGPEIIQSVLNREVPAPKGGASSDGAGAGTGIRLSQDEEAVAGRFRKMLKMGLPEDAVRQKMTVEGVDQKVISAVVGGGPEVAAAPAPASSAISLTPEEDGIAARFKKMLNMGLPDDAVKHKMVAEGVDQKIISAVVGGPAPAPAAPAGASLSAEEEATAGRFRKMQKMGLPDDVVKHKMVSEGVDEKIIAAVLGGEVPAAAPSAPTAAPAISLSADEEAVAGRFRKMLKMGLPDDAVKHKMVAEGVDEKIIKSVLSGGEPTPAAAPSPAPAAAPTLTAEEEETASRFRKMLTMGLPEDAVKHKMVQEGVGTRIIAAVVGGTVPTSDSPAAATPVASSAPPLSDEEEATAAKYRKMLKMGMPDDAVKHKMTQDGVSEKIVSVVLGGGAPPPGAVPAPAGSAGGAAYIVVVNDDPGSAPPPIATAADIRVNPDDKFSVTVGDGSGDKAKGSTKLMTLDEVAAATGQSQEELEKMVKEKQAAGEAAKFVLDPVGGGGAQPAGDLFEVQVPVNGGVAAAAAGGAPRDPNKNYAEVGEGKEVVDTKLADAARAVSALGDLDMKNLLEKLQKGDMELLLNKLKEAEKRQKKLEKQLAQSGIAIAEDIDYGEAKQKVDEIAKRMGEIGGSDVTVEDKEEQNKLREEYFKLEQQMERFNTALMLTEEYQAEQDRIERKWEDDNAPGNLEALKMIRRHMPVKIRHMSEADLTNTPSPNGKFLPKAIAKKFKRTNVLQALRLNPDDLERMHPSTLENMRVTGLTLTERRALYCHLKPLGPKWEKNKAEKMTERKWTWYQMMKSNFKENLAPYQRHVDQFGPPDNHVGCTLLGKQCPIKADKMIDYDNDYGYTDEAEYEISDVKKADADDPGAKAMQEALELARAKKANERADLLKKHYKGKLLQVSKANGSCESMDEAMDRMENHMLKWIEDDKGDKMVEADKKKEVANFTEGINELKLSTLDFAQRSGMQMSGKKKAGGDSEDIRSRVEAGLSDEVWECSQEFFKFIKNRMKETEMKDTRVEKTIELIENMLGELHTKNEELLKKLSAERPDRSRKLKKIEDLKKEVEDRKKPEEEAAAEAGGGGGGGPPGPPRGGGGRGGLLDAIAGGRGRGRGGGGRGGLLDAISGARGRGRGGGGGGRGGLLDAIAGARGKGGDKGGGGGRGGLLDAIAGARGGKGRGGGGDAGGRGGLLAAIAARGGG